MDKVLFDESKRAIGVVTIEGKVYNASKEIVVAGGAIDSPKILLRSGVGPAVELKDLSIPLVQDVPGVGKNLMDHCLCITSHMLKEEYKPILNPARDPLLSTNSQCPMAWIQLPKILESQECKHVLFCSTFCNPAGFVPLISSFVKTASSIKS